MTTAIDQAVERRTEGAPTVTMRLALAAICGRAAKDGRAIHWPSERYRHDPVAFAREVLGMQPWSKQVEILEAVRDHKRVAIRSGHKVGKSNTAAILALWFYCSFEDARVVMTSVTSRQVDAILWREVRKLHSKSKQPIGGDMHEMARSGLKAEDFREIVGFTAREAEAVAGVSGANLLYLVDEASGVPKTIFEAIEGNRAGGARIVLMGNPTQTEGEFFDAFDDTKPRLVPYRCIHISSEDSPNVIAGREVIPGLALREWVEEKRVEWGITSPLYQVRVRGNFVRNEEGRIISLALLTAAEQRYEDTTAEGQMQIGVDPAGPGEGGDESAFAVRIGQKIVHLHAQHGLTDQGIVVQILGLLSQFKRAHSSKPIVAIDREGPVGNAVLGLLRAHLELSEDEFTLLGVRASDGAQREPKIYPRTRDELWANFAQWLREGGALPSDSKLAKEAHAPKWVGVLNGKIKVTDKNELRKMLGRSPDRCDACILSVWSPAYVIDSDGKVTTEKTETKPGTEEQEFHQHTMDPYSGLDWTQSKASNPWG